jgi:protein translocase SecG subunit
MQQALFIFQIIVSILLSAVVLLQVKGTGFGRVWGGLSTSSTRRGLEGLIFKLTFVLAALFIVVSLVSLLSFSDC